MTHPQQPRPVSARTRAEDKGPKAKARAWWNKWGELIKGVSGITACVGCLILGALMWQASEQRANDQRIVRVLAQSQAKTAAATAAAARATCRRSRILGPQLADYYALDPKFPRPVLAEYRRTIPKTCPK